jgi:hypothetical protein
MPQWNFIGGSHYKEHKTNYIMDTPLPKFVEDSREILTFEH